MWCCCWFSVSSLWCTIFASGKRPVVCLCILIMSRVNRSVLMVCPGASPFLSHGCSQGVRPNPLPEPHPSQIIVMCCMPNSAGLQGYSMPINSCTDAVLCDVCAWSYFTAAFTSNKVCVYSVTSPLWSRRHGYFSCGPVKH